MTALRRLRTRKSALALAATLALGAAPWQDGLAAACTFNPASGNWNVAGNWSCGLVPSGPAGDSATIGSGKVVTVNDGRSIFNLSNAGTINVDAATFTLQGGGSVNNAGGAINVASGVVLNQLGVSITGGTLATTGSGRVVSSNSGANFLSGVTLNGRLDMAGATGVERINGGFTLNGTVDIGQNSVLAPQGDQTIAGSGTIVFADSNSTNRLNVEAGNLTLASGITVRGQTGIIGQQAFVGGAATLTNNGAIRADTAGGTITLQVNGLTTNNGTLAAQNGGTLVLNSAVAGSSGSQILAGAGSTVLQNGVTLSGAMNIVGTGSFRASNNGNNFLDGVNFAGTLDLASATGIERVSSGLTLANATIAIGQNSVLAPQGNQTIAGTGTIVFADSNNTNRLNVEAGNLTLASGITVRGQTGIIGQQAFVGGAATLTNNGTISADTAGGTITLQVNGLTTNNGTLAAQNGGTLVLSSNVLNNAGSQILAGAGSTVLQNGVTLNGVINVAGGGTFRASNSSNNFLNAAQFNGTLDLAGATGVERATGGLVLNGTVAIGNNSIFAAQGDQTISGNGSFVFADANASNRLNLEAGNLTLGPNITVRGGNGLIGQQTLIGGAATLTNNGSIQADVAGRSITLQVNGLTTNNGTLAALNGGTLNLNSAVTGSSSGQIVAGAGSVVMQNGVTLSGNMNLTGAGSFRPSNNSNNFLSGVTLSGTLDLASATGVERVTGGLALNGATINIGANSTFAPQGSQTISGNGQIVFVDDGNVSNRLNVEAGTLTLASGVTVRGGNGVIGQQSFIGGAADLVNQGLITADRNGRSITIDVSGSFINQALARAENGGTLVLQNGTFDNSAGTLRALDTSTVHLSNVELSGGVLDTSGSGRFTLANNGNFVNGTTVNGRIDMAGGTGVLRISDGGMVLNGLIDIGSNSIVATQGSQTISGSGQIVFADGNASNRLNIEAGSLVLGAGVTVRGQQGVIGQQTFIGGAATLTNLGTIHADGGGTIAIAPNGTLTNDGLFRASNGTLAVQRNVGGSGTLQVDAAGVMTLTNGGNTQGSLAMGGTGAALNLGTGNLTLNADYTNAGAGAGNAFNRRAGVTGGGQIVAGGNVSQVISGASVSNGGTANATLTIGNVHVGANTYGYTIGNGGTTGPTLRGAVQTSVNGASLTDARLSGSGVTAANYNAGGPGGAGAAQTVVFTAASAGALAPMSGQVLNLRSNFENIADQKLNIVLGAGAAAYNLAGGSAGTPVTVANQRVNGTNTVALTVSNTATAGSFSEDLNASVGSVSGPVVGSGAVSGLLAGASSGGINVGVATGSAGAKTGTVNLAYTSTGTVNGVGNGLGQTSVGSQAVTVSGNVYQAASGQLVGNTLNFGTLQVGQQVSQSLVVRNTASGPAGFVEDLNASFGAAGNGQISGSGSLSGITAGSNSTAANGTMTVTVTGSTAGALNSGIAVNYFSAGTVNGASNGLGVLGVGSEQFGVNGTISAVGNVINQASPQFGSTSVNLGAVRVGVASPTATLALTNQATAAPQAALNASIGSNGTPVIATGSVSLLAPGASSNALQVGLNTAVAGNYTGANAGSATVQLVSDASNVGGCAPNCQLNLAPQTITVSGKVYTAAVGQLGTPVVDFGIVRVGDTVSAKNITVSNTAAVTALNDTLRATLSGVSGPFTGGGAASGIAAQGSGQISVGLNTAGAGVFSSNGSVGFLSQNPDMADVSAGANAGVQVKAQVNNLANADFDLLSGLGTLTDLGNGHYQLNLGNLALGSNGHWMLQIDNEVAGPADALRGSFDLGSVDDFVLGGFGLVDLEAGQAQGGLGIDFTAGQLGQFEDTVVFNGFSYNASDPTGLSLIRSLQIVANVFDPNGGGNVPEPGTLALLMLAALGVWRSRAPALQRQRGVQ